MKAKALVMGIMLFMFLARAYPEPSLPTQEEYKPPNGKGQVVVVISGQTGPGNYAYIAKDLAEQGYYAILVDGNDFWIKGGGGETLLKDVITHVLESPHALPGKAAVIGFSLGGASALTYATRMPELVSAVVAYFPATSYIKNPDDFVSKMKVQTLMFAGGRDTYKNCCLIETARKLAEAAKKTEGKVKLEIVEYPSAQHGFVIKSLKDWSYYDARDAFDRTLKHLSQYSGQ